MRLSQRFDSMAVRKAEGRVGVGGGGGRRGGGVSVGGVWGAVGEPLRNEQHCRLLFLWRQVHCMFLEEMK